MMRIKINKNKNKKIKKNLVSQQRNLALIGTLFPVISKSDEGHGI
jgi:hypothetical protein